MIKQHSFMVKKFYDTYYPPSKKVTRRDSVRGVIIDDDFKVAILKITTDDIFGHRDHYELIGGGLEKDETLQEAAKRESLEESGATVENIIFHGKIIHRYNLLNTINHIYFYSAIVVNKTLPTFTEKEKQLIEKVEWINIFTLENLLKTYPCQLVGKLIHRRELFIIQQVIKSLSIK